MSHSWPFLGKRDDSKKLGGSDVGFTIPGMGTVVGPNITPDKATGIGTWTRSEIVTALTTGVRPDGRILSPVMPWQDLAKLDERDVLALAIYLQSIQPVVNRTPGPFGLGEPLSVFSLRLMPPSVGRQR